MTDRIVIIGGGIAGYSAAFELSKYPCEITLIEKDKIGGTCLNRGCIPTKLFLHNSVGSEYKDIIIKNNEVLEKLRKSIERLVEKKKISYILDEAEIESENSIILKRTGETVKFDKLIISSGSEVIVPEVLRSIDLITSDSFFNLESISGKIVIVGGGYIGVEFATILKNLGCEVTIIEKENSLLPNLDLDISSELARSFEKRGIKIITGKEIERVEENRLYLSEGLELDYDHIFLAGGRKPCNIRSKIEFERLKGIIMINEYLETSNKNVFCIGDANGKFMLANKAEYEAKLIARNMFSEIKEKVDYSKLPFFIFCEPKIGIIGLNLSSELNRSIKVPFSKIGKAFCDDSFDGFLKIFFDKDKKITGARVINKNAIEVMSALIVIVQGGLTCKDVANMVFGHPTSAEIIKEAAIIACEI
ncbi:MAG: NAD(P)/FAD-dependent oxidoreductase [Candidatus Pacearchaeota archaeon]|jgi:dihydrolipoamide dehydrogenase